MEVRHLKTNNIIPQKKPKMQIKLQLNDNYAMYLRKSRADLEAEAQGEFDTLQKHLEILTDLAVRENYHVTDIYKELVSGDTIESRPKMQELLKAVKAGKYKGVLVTEISRLARGNGADQSEVSDAFSKSKTLIITPRKIYDPMSEMDQDFFDFELFMARQEYKYIKRRMQAGKKQAALEGQYLASRCPYGYDKVIIDRKKTLVKNENAKYIKILSDYWGEGHNERECVEYLYSIGAPPPSASAWNIHTVRYMLKSETYIGKARIGIDKNTARAEICVDGLWEPILTEEEFNRNVSRFGAVTHRKGKTLPHNPLAGLIKCKRCGYALSLSSYGWVYHMAKLEPHCSVCGITINPLMEHICKALTEQLRNQTVIYEEKQKEAIDYAPQIRNAENKLNRIYTSYENGVYSDMEFIQRRGQIQKQIEELKRLQEEQCAQARTKPKMLESDLHSIIEMVKDPEVPVDAKNEFLKSFIKRIDYDRTDHVSDPQLFITFR